MDFVFRILKFGIVGISGIFVDFATTWFCKEKLKSNKYISNSIGFIFAATSNYILNRNWTFQSNNTQIIKEYSSFLIISMIGLGINNLIIYWLHGKMKLNFYFSKIIATGLVVVWNFLANYYYTFRQF